MGGIAARLRQFHLMTHRGIVNIDSTKPSPRYQVTDLIHRSDQNAADPELSCPKPGQLRCRLIDRGFPVGDGAMELFEQQTKSRQIAFFYGAIVIAI